ncbi:MAG: tryptophan-rich sensory protein [Deltaproteobacteria bacterium]|nr:MAG: tryptophan-rich sensory protein [Deltaproteobacteria bacterium]
MGVLVGLIALCFAVAAIGGLSTADGVREWYPTLNRPDWRPPNWLFGPVWTMLYTAMAVAMWLVWRREGVGRGAAVWSVQLLLNALWSPLFFGVRRLDLALVDIVGMWLAIAATIAVFASRSRVAAGLLVPYLAWVSFATALNGWIWAYN